MKKKDQYGLVGYPLGHSFSQGFFTKKFESEAIDAIYSNYELADIAMLTDVIENDPCLKGLNVTIPYKEKVIKFLSGISVEAQAIGAVNVLKVQRVNGKNVLFGFNSDVYGFVESIRPLIDSAIHRKALVLGTGGASKAVVYGLKQLSIDSQLVSRNKSEGVLGYDDLNEVLIADYQVVVNCTPLGTSPNVDVAPPIPYLYLNENYLLYDLVYNPAKTKFLRLGEEQGVKIKNGAEMLELQALKAWEIWNTK